MRSKGNQLFCTALIALALVCFLTACGADENHNGQESVKENNPAQQETGSEEQTIEAKDSYQEILLGNEDFTNIDIADQHRKLNLGNIKKAASDEDWIEAKVTKFTIIDLDRDGEMELVLGIQVNENPDYGFEILYPCSGEIYGFTLVYRQFIELKTDGTFYVSSGAADTGVCRLQFSENGYVMEELSDETGSQKEKEDAEWYDLTENNISQLLQKY